MHFDSSIDVYNCIHCLFPCVFNIHLFIITWEFFALNFMVHNQMSFFNSTVDSHCPHYQQVILSESLHYKLKSHDFVKQTEKNSCNLKYKRKTFVLYCIFISIVNWPNLFSDLCVDKNAGVNSWPGRRRRNRRDIVQNDTTRRCIKAN